MMEIAYGALILGCATRGLIFGIVFIFVYQYIESRHLGRASVSGFARCVGRGLTAGSLVGFAQLVAASAGDGFPPRIVQSAGLAFLLLAALGTVIAHNGRARRSQQRAAAIE